MSRQPESKKCNAERISWKGIGDVAIQVLNETDNDSVMWGDCWLLDEIAQRFNKKLLDIHPLNRHPRVLSALERSGLFEKRFVRLNFRGNNCLVRDLKIIQHNKR